MSEITTWIDEAIATLQLDFRKCSDLERARIVATAHAKFVSGNPRVWWLNLKLASTKTSSVVSSLLDVIPLDTKTVWFIPEDESDALTVYEGDVALLPRLLDECPLFEYYIVAQDFLWLLGETDHDEFYICKDPVAFS